MSIFQKSHFNVFINLDSLVKFNTNSLINNIIKAVKTLMQFEATNKHILVHFEQGFGDSIMFVRFLEEFKKKQERKKKQNKSLKSHKVMLILRAQVQLLKVLLPKP